MILRGSMGLGDAVYLNPVVKYYTERGEDVTIITRYPEIFFGLNCKIILDENFIDCQNSARTTTTGTNIYEDTLIMAGIDKTLPLNFEYVGTKRIFPTSKKVCVIRQPTAPAKGELESVVMIPDSRVYQTIINSFKDRVFFVLCGKQINSTEKLTGCDMDCTSETGIINILETIDGADLILAQPGHFVSMAEALKKKLFCVFARAGLLSQVKRFRFNTPEKILSCKTSVWCIDDDPINDYLRKFEVLLNA